jgi:hypothetical protein
MSSWEEDFGERSCSSITVNKEPKCYQQSDLQARQAVGIVQFMADRDFSLCNHIQTGAAATYQKDNRTSSPGNGIARA